MNKIKHKEAETSKEEKKVSSKQARGFIKALNVFGLFDKKAIIRFMPFLFFLTVLAIFYIYNSYIAERTIIEINRSEKAIKELRAEYISAKAELMVKSKQTELAKEVATIGLKESIVAPQKIIVKEQPELKTK